MTPMQETRRQTLYPRHASMRGRVGVVIPVWLAPDTAPEQAERLLETTLADSPACLRPDDVVVVSDGSPVAAAAARAVRDRLGREWGSPFDLLELPENGGKGAALGAGIRRLLDTRERAPLDWIAARDADGDHFLDDLPHLFRAGEQLAEECPGQPACVIGRRASLHAPMGWVRGEYELFLNEVLVDAVAFALAREGRVWDTRYLVDRAPDLQSGYKLYSRAAAELSLRALEAEAAAHPELNVLRTGMEIVPFVSLALGGGIFAEVERKTFFDQPVTSYGSVDFSRFYGSKLAWALRRCGVPPAAAALMMDGVLARRPLYCDPQGRESLLRTRRLVLESLEAGTAEGPPAEPRMRRIL